MALAKIIYNVLNMAAQTHDTAMSKEGPKPRTLELFLAQNSW